jgi:hypothetical protein
MHDKVAAPQGNWKATQPIQKPTKGGAMTERRLGIELARMCCSVSSSSLSSVIAFCISPSSYTSPCTYSINLKVVYGVGA